MNVNDKSDAHAFMGQVLRDFAATLPASARFSLLTIGETAMATLSSGVTTAYDGPVEVGADVPAA